MWKMKKMCDMMLYYTVPEMGAGYCEELVCLPVCLSTRVSLELCIQSSGNLFCALLVATPLSSPSGVVIRNIFSFFGIKSYLSILGPMTQVGHTRKLKVTQRGQHGFDTAGSQRILNIRLIRGST